MIYDAIEEWLHNTYGIKNIKKCPNGCILTLHNTIRVFCFDEYVITQLYTSGNVKTFYKLYYIDPSFFDDLQSQIQHLLGHKSTTTVGTIIDTLI